MIETPIKSDNLYESMLKQPIDRIALITIGILMIVITLLIGGGGNCDQFCIFNTRPKVKNFTWNNQTIGVEDTAFIVTFDRPMDQNSIENNLTINPPLLGKYSWVGRKLAYTLINPPLYGTNYRLKIVGGKEKFNAGEGETMQPFESNFKTRDRSLVYISLTPEDRGRLIHYNFTQNKPTYLTPPNLNVTDFQFYPQGKAILFSATDKMQENPQDVQLYQVQLGTNIDNFDPETSLKLILDNQDYQILKFKLSQDGKVIVTQRLNRKNPADSGLWMLKENQEPVLITQEVVGDFLITPDSKTIAVSQGQGVAILNLKPNEKPLDFMANFGQTLSFSDDGTLSTMIDFNMNNPKMRYVRSLYLVSNQNTKEKLLDTAGTLLGCQFNTKKTYLYCLMTQVINDANEYREEPFLGLIDLKTKKNYPLLGLPKYHPDIHLSLAKDGSGLVFDQVMISNDPNFVDSLRTASGEIIASSKMWVLLLDINNPKVTENPQLQELPFIGFRPQWSP